MELNERRIRCVALDAVGTVIAADPPVAQAYAQIGQEYGSRERAEDVKARFAPAMRAAEADIERQLGEPGRTNERLEREFWRQVVRDVLPDVSNFSQCFDRLYEHFALPSSWRCFDDVAETIRELRQRGYRLLIASNFDERLHRICDGWPELRDVTNRVISSEIGYRKTHRGFYSALVAAAECAPDEVLMVGDDFTNDIASSRAVGLQAVHLCRDADSLAPLKTSETGEVRSLTDLLEWLP